MNPVNGAVSSTDRAPARRRPAGAAASPRPRVVEHDAEGLFTLRPGWSALLRDSAADALFLTHEWQQAWWESFGGDFTARILEVREGDRLLGIAPLYARRQSVMGVPLTVLRLIGDGSGDGDDLDLIARRGSERAVVEAVLDHLRHQPDWHVLRLRPVPAESPVLAAVRDAVDDAGWYREEHELECTTSPLPDTWEEFLMGLKSRFRSRLRSTLRRHVDVDEAEVRMIRSDRKVGDSLDRLFELHTERWNDADEPGSFADPRRRQFYRDLARRALRRGWLRLYELHHRGEVAAVQIGYVYDDTFLQIQEGFDLRFSDISPGVALRAAVIRDCIESGVHTYDNLLGTSRAKMRWGGKPRTVHDLWIGRGRGAVLLRLRRGLRPWKARLTRLRDGLRREGGS